MTQSLAAAGTTSPVGVDPRGPRFAAAITAAVLALVLVLHATSLGVLLLALQTVVFAVGALRGPSATPYAAVYRSLVRPRLAPPAELEDVRPLRFAQSVGFGFTAVALVSVAFAPVLALLAIAAAFVAAFLNAVFGYCLGCEVYLLLRRVIPAAH
jgi:hypothetical protein